jgi:hypothetical protein
MQVPLILVSGVLVFIFFILFWELIFFSRLQHAGNAEWKSHLIKTLNLENVVQRAQAVSHLALCCWQRPGWTDLTLPMQIGILLETTQGFVFCGAPDTRAIIPFTGIATVGTERLKIFPPRTAIRFDLNATDGLPIIKGRVVPKQVLFAFMDEKSFKANSEKARAKQQYILHILESSRPKSKENHTMASTRHSFIANASLLNKLWIVLGGVLGGIFGLTASPFSQLGIYEKIIGIVVLVGWGIGITRQCKPTKTALIGGVIVPLFLNTELFLTSRSVPVSPVTIIGLVSGGILAGILAGTAWLGALIGAFIMALITSILSITIRGTLEWAWIFTFTTIGIIGGAMIQQATRDIAQYNFGKSRRQNRNKNELPEWLKQKNLEKKNEETDHEST